MKYFLKTLTASFILLASVTSSIAQYTHQDTLRGSIGAARAWWNVTRYNIKVDVDIANRSIKGTNEIVFAVTKTGRNRYMQIDLQRPMEIEKVEDASYKNAALPFRMEGNAYFIDFGDREFIAAKTGKEQQSVIIHFKGKPRVAVNPPWDGGWVWSKDAKGNPWVTAACQGLGASVWYPCKDHQSDEPDNGASLSITVPDSLVAIGNGRLKNKKAELNGYTTWQWEVTSPINNYNIIPYIGKYTHWEEKFAGEKGPLDASFWVLDYNLDKAKEHFGHDVDHMLSCFEHWFGPYPFYEDGYKLVEAPHLGMEHQSAVAYGNKYMNGYLGGDLSGSGWGKNWDYIVVHESGHEWFANNITSNDIADMWVHEGFTTYSEVLFVECQNGKKAADEYCQGLRRNIRNDRTIIGNYGVNKEGSEDMYFKGANLLHTIRQIIDNDSLFRQILRGLNKDFYHQTVNTKDVEKYIIQKSGKDLSLVFDQYLRNTQLPVLEYRIKGRAVSFHWNNCIKDFNMPVKVSFGKNIQWVRPTAKWKTITLPAGYDGKSFIPDPNFYIASKLVS
ncbi:MAG TPA: M1 family metallopeptidase [Chitinophagaceae bacterium]|nr:M1 family metallopeptidase [Chitinophagaceae bacterium]